MTNPEPVAVEVAGLRALVIGREPEVVVDRLGAVAAHLEAGEPIDAEDRALVTRIRHEYGHELAELKDPD